MWDCWYVIHLFIHHFYYYYYAGTATALEWNVNIKTVYKQWHRLRELISKDILSCPIQFHDLRVGANEAVQVFEIDECYIERIWIDANSPFLNQLVFGIKVRVSSNTTSLVFLAPQHWSFVCETNSRQKSWDLDSDHPEIRADR